MRVTLVAIALLTVVAVPAGCWWLDDSFRLTGKSGELPRLPLTWSLDADSSLRKLGRETFDDPLIFGMNVVAALAEPSVSGDGEAVGMIADRFDGFMQQRNEHGYWHHAAYNDFPEGWYSGMDFASMAMAALALHEATDDPRFLQTGTGLISQMIRPVEEGGVNHHTSRAKCWLGEYVWPSMTEAGQDFVLNGAVLALLALEIYVQIDADNAEFKGVRDCTLKSMQELMPAYFYADGSWGRYKLNPAAPNMTHYVIYEINEFDALFSVTRNEYYRQQAEARRDLMKRNFKVFRDGDEFFFTQLGAPHPFTPDIYQTRIVFKDKAGGTVLGAVDTFDFPLKDRLFMRGPVSADARVFDLHAFSGESSILVVRDGELVSPSQQQIALSPEVEPALDLVAGSGQCYVIEPERMIAPDDPSYSQNDQGRLYLKFEPVPIENFEIFTIDVAGPEAVTWSIGLHTTDGRELFRYLDRHEDGSRRIVPLSRLGFEDPGSAGDMISGATIYLYTDGMEGQLPFCFHGLQLYPDYFAFGQAAVASYDRLQLRTD